MGNKSGETKKQFEELNLIQETYLHSKGGDIMKQRKKSRLSEYDYSLPGYYFVTICTKEKYHYFGSIENDKMKLNKIGAIAKEFWEKIPEHFLQ